MTIRIELELADIERMCTRLLDINYSGMEIASKHSEKKHAQKLREKDEEIVRLKEDISYLKEKIDDKNSLLEDLSKYRDKILDSFDRDSIVHSVARLIRAVSDTSLDNGTGNCRYNKIGCIKEIRMITGLGLRESKNLVEDNWGYSYDKPECVRPDEPPHAQDSDEL